MLTSATKKQQEVLAFIEGYLEEKTYPPTLKEIRDRFNFASHSTAQFHVNQLVKAGLLKKSPTGGRRISQLKDDEVVEIPILGTVAAGGPLEAIEDNSQELKEIPKSMLKGSKSRHYFLRVKGDSMVDKGILSGDLVLIKEQADFDNGDIVVIANKEWEVTLKQVVKEKTHITVKPANPKYQVYSLQLDECSVVGKQVALIRES